MTKYLVHLIDGNNAEITAETVNLGLKKLWFYDGEKNLLAVYVWERILGFKVVGSAAEQQLTELLLHDEKTKDVNRRLQLAEKGELWLSLNEASEHLDQSALQLGQAWLRLHEWRTSKPTEMAVLLQRQRAELQRIEARFVDQQKALNMKMQMNLDELTKLLH